MNEGERRYMVWYQDDAVEPIGALAASRADAWRIGQMARPSEWVEAAVREDEGSKNDISEFDDSELSTLEEPRRFFD